MKKLIRNLVVAMAVAAFANAASANLIVNGDFESGNTGFTSGYHFDNSSGGLATGGEDGVGAGNYSVVTDPHFSHSAFPTAGDHTSGSGNMMVVNGSGIAGKTVWTQTVAPPLTVGATYEFSAWVMNVYPDSPANLQISFGGSVLGTFSATGLDDWQQFTFTFVATANNTAGLIDLNLTAFGNDFALDDISLNRVPGVPDGGSAVALLGIALTGIEVLRRKLSRA